MDPTRGLVVLPFSGWDAASAAYDNGVQLIEFTPTSIATAGAAHTTGWVERGIFVNNRIVSLSDLALSVVDYSNPLAPKVTAQLTLARSVVTAQPDGSTVAEVSSDWWDNDVTHSDVRVLPLADADESRDESAAPTRRSPASTPASSRTATSTTSSRPSRSVLPGRRAVLPTKSQPQCSGWQQQVQVVDLSGGGAKLRGKVALPIDPNGGRVGWGWYGCYAYDWFNGADVVQVNGSTLAFRRWDPASGADGPERQVGRRVERSLRGRPVESRRPGPRVVRHHERPDRLVGQHARRRKHALHVALRVDHRRPRHQGRPGDQARRRCRRANAGAADRALLPGPHRPQRPGKHPRIGSRINVPGALVGGSPSDPSILYTIDYGWDTAVTRDFLDVVKVSGDLAYLQSKTPLDGYVGNVIVRGTTAYMTSQVYPDKLEPGRPQMELHQIDLSNPRVPVDRVASGPGGWGWLLDVQGDRAMVTSGWGEDGLDIYRLSASARPVYDQFVRTRGWSINSLSRQGNQIFLSSGYWGVQAVTLD